MNIVAELKRIAKELSTEKAHSRTQLMHIASEVLLPNEWEILRTIPFDGHSEYILFVKKDNVYDDKVVTDLVKDILIQLASFGNWEFDNWNDEDGDLVVSFRHDCEW